MTTTRKKTVNYINNKDFFEAIVGYQARLREAEAKGKPKPKIPEYIGECFLKIATNFTNNINFRNAFASFHKEEMISDAVLQCIKYLDNFDAEKSRNPFAYFTQYCRNAFVQRLELEKKHLYIKLKGIKTLECPTFTTEDYSSQSEDHSEESMDMVQYENYNDFIKDYEAKHNITAKRSRRKSKKDPVLWED